MAITTLGGSILTTLGGSHLVRSDPPPPVPNPLPTILFTIQQLRIRIGLLPTDPSRDADIAVVIMIALAMAENFCDRKFELQADTQVFTHIAGYSVSLHRFPLISITSLTGDDAAQTFQYHADDDTGLIQWDGRTRAHKLTVAYTGGYDASTLPADLSWAILNIFDAIWTIEYGVASGGASIGSVKKAKIGDMDITYETGSAAVSAGGADSAISSTVANVLGNYKRWSA